MLIKSSFLSTSVIFVVVWFGGCASPESQSGDFRNTEGKDYPYPYESEEDKVKCTVHFIDEDNTKEPVEIDHKYAGDCDWLVASALDFYPEKKSDFSVAQTVDFSQASLPAAEYPWYKRISDANIPELMSAIEVKRLEADSYRIQKNSSIKEVGCIGVLGEKDGAAYVIGLSLVRKGGVSIVYQYDVLDFGNFSRDVETEFYYTPCTYYLDLAHGSREKQAASK